MFCVGVDLEGVRFNGVVERDVIIEVVGEFVFSKGFKDFNYLFFGLFLFFDFRGKSGNDIEVGSWVVWIVVGGFFGFCWGYSYGFYGEIWLFCVCGGG